MVTTFYPPYHFGGDAVFVYRLANELAKRGHAVDVIHDIDAYYAARPPGHEPAGAYPHEGAVTVHSLRSGGGILSPLWTHQTAHPGPKAARLREILSKGRFDVINYHNMSLIGLRALAYGDGVKLYTMHEHWLVCPLHTLWKFNREPCARKQCIACSLQARRPPQLWRSTGLAASLLRHIDAFIAVSAFSAAKHREMGLDASLRIEHIPYFVPVPDAPGLPVRAPRDRPYFLFVGRLEKMKGVQVLLEAFSTYTGADLVVVGEGGYGPTLQALAGHLPHVHFLGRQPYDRLQHLFRDALALLVPSVGYETFGIVMLEAFAQETPVIANDLGPLPELIAQSGGGVIYQGMDALVRALRQFAGDEALRRRLGMQGHQSYLTHWTPEPVLQQYFSLITGLQRATPEARRRQPIPG